MGLGVNLLVDTVIKLAVFLPIMGLVGWWLFTAWFVDKALHSEEFVAGAALWLIAFSFGANSIMHGGWGSMTVLGMVYVALLALAVWEYVYWRRRELQHLQSELVRYQRAIDTDPTAAAAYSLLGETHLKLRQYDEAEAALEKALELDPESRNDRRLLRRARAKEGGPRKWWAD